MAQIFLFLWKLVLSVYLFLLSALKLVTSVRDFIKCFFLCFSETAFKLGFPNTPEICIRKMRALENIFCLKSELEISL